ncbi:Rieske 2Fe-2S domain-containing protein [Actinocatenispora sera]|uniref:Rieske domain-containing protein n=1 Tax=Actinocatenispora sera TaxID=390989 RepID=A0A810LBR8_9ACTN|nr:Rieske 2Fe-2S domain-containing protein [Actinocatenispora sera]BCJ31701.1 hypothetical protein Asera_58090 [Actinocatenispora sera]
MNLSTPLDRVAGWSALDAIARPIRKAIQSVLPTGLADVLHGRPLGHALHPTLVELPVGAWTSAALLDLVPGQRRAADLLIAVGCAGALPAVVTGWADWSALRPEQQRVGLIHAAGNVTAVGLYAASLVARLRGNRRRGKLLAAVAYGAAGTAAFVGGHLAYRQAAGVNHAAAVDALAPSEWTSVALLTDLPEGRPVAAQAGQLAVVLYRDGSQVHALADRCAHLAGPLHEGTVSDGAVTCPWHGSRFDLATGALRQGPATAAQPALDARIRDGRIEVRRG